MIIYKPMPVLFQNGEFHVYAYGLILGLAFLIPYIISLKRIKNEKLSLEIGTKIAVLIAIVGPLGARILYLLLHLKFYILYPNQIWRVDAGGLASYGGFIVGFLAIYIYSKIRKFDMKKYLDYYAPYIALGIAIARIGCFINYCCQGLPTKLIWGVQVAGDAARHPTQIYHAIAALTIFGILTQLRKKKQFDGFLFAIFLVLYGTLRFTVDFFRYYDEMIFGFSASQIVCVAVVVCSLLWIARKYSQKKP